MTTKALGDHAAGMTTSSVVNPANNQEFVPKPSATRMVGAPTVACTRTAEAMAEEAESEYKPN